MAVSTVATNVSERPQARYVLPMALMLSLYFGSMQSMQKLEAHV